MFRFCTWAAICNPASDCSSQISQNNRSCLPMNQFRDFIYLANTQVAKAMPGCVILERCRNAHAHSLYVTAGTIRYSYLFWWIFSSWSKKEAGFIWIFWGIQLLIPYWVRKVLFIYFQRIDMLLSFLFRCNTIQRNFELFFRLEFQHTISSVPSQWAPLLISAQ